MTGQSGTTITHQSTPIGRPFQVAEYISRSVVCAFELPICYREEKGLPRSIARVENLGLHDVYMQKDGPLYYTPFHLSNSSPEEVQRQVRGAVFKRKGEPETKVEHIYDGARRRPT